MEVQSITAAEPLPAMLDTQEATKTAKAATSKSSSTSEGMNSLGKDDFLSLLITQMENQDPLNPRQDTEFIAQMAQFSTLEQSKSMQQDIAALRSEQQLLQANAVLGHVVALEDEQGTLIRGPVSAIQLEAGTPKLVVNGQPYDLSTLLSVEPPAHS